MAVFSDVGRLSLFGRLRVTVIQPQWKNSHVLILDNEVVDLKPSLTALSIQARSIVRGASKLSKQRPHDQLGGDGQCNLLYPEGDPYSE